MLKHVFMMFVWSSIIVSLHAVLPIGFVAGPTILTSDYVRQCVLEGRETLKRASKVSTWERSLESVCDDYGKRKILPLVGFGVGVSSAAAFLLLARATYDNHPFVREAAYLGLIGLSGMANDLYKTGKDKKDSAQQKTSYMFFTSIWMESRRFNAAGDLLYRDEFERHEQTRVEQIDTTNTTQRLEFPLVSAVAEGVMVGTALPILGIAAHTFCTAKDWVLIRQVAVAMALFTYVKSYTKTEHELVASQSQED